MAARASKAATPALFKIAEKQIVALYDAGVLSPAVLHHVIAAYAQSGIDWNGKSSLRTVDDRSMQEAVVLIMMPGRALRSAQKDFMSVVEHLANAPKNPFSASDEEQNEEEDDADEALLSQLSGKSQSTTKASNGKTAKKSSAKRAGFNPLVGARAIGKH